LLIVTVQFYDGAEFKGHFGVGRNFLETQREGGFFSQRVSSAEVRRFLDLVGVNASSVYGKNQASHRNSLSDNPVSQDVGVARRFLPYLPIAEAPQLTP
jgi:hypothetical protein